MGKSTLDFDSNFAIDTEAKTIVLVGKTGSGKSATGNSIIGADVFDSMPNFGGVTTTCQMHRSVLPDGQILNVIDTPGLSVSSIDPKSIGYEIAQCIKMAKINGIHAVLVVVSLGAHFSLEEASAIESLSRFFGGKIGDYMILAFTHGDVLRRISLDELLARCFHEPLAKTLELCGNRHILFDNVTNDELKKSQQREKLLGLVDTVVNNSGGIPYTNELFVDSPDASDTGLNRAQREARELRETQAEIQELLNKVIREKDEENQKKTNNCAISEITSAIERKIESKLQETSLRLENQLAEKFARMQAEDRAQEQSNDEIRKLREDMERAQRYTDDTLKKIQLRLGEVNQEKHECSFSEKSSAMELQFESNLHERFLQFGKLLADKKVARLRAEKKSNDERSKLREGLERVERDGEMLRLTDFASKTEGTPEKVDNMPSKTETGDQLETTASRAQPFIFTTSTNSTSTKSMRKKIISMKKKGSRKTRNLI